MGQLISIGRSLVMREEHLAAVLALIGGDELNDSAVTHLDELEAVGLLRERVLAPRLAEIVEVVASPALKMSVEVLGPWGLEVDLVWLTPHAAVIATAQQDELMMNLVDPTFLLFDLARRVGLRHRPRRSAPEGSIQVQASVLDAIHDWLRESGTRSLLDLSDDLEHRYGIAEPKWRAAVVEAVAHRMQSWRITSEWMQDEGPVEQRLSVIDGGPAGLFRVEPGDSDESLVFSGLSESATLKLIRSCLPQAPTVLSEAG